MPRSSRKSEVNFGQMSQRSKKRSKRNSHKSSSKRDNSSSTSSRRNKSARKMRRHSSKASTLRDAERFDAKAMKEAEEEFGAGGLNMTVWGFDDDDSDSDDGEVKKRRNFLHQFSIEELRHLNPKNLKKIWDYYDADHGGTLDAHEITIMAVECIERTLKMLADQMKEEKPNIKPKTLQKAVDAEKFYYLPGENKSDQDTIADMVKLLGGTLDIDNSGDITVTKFNRQFPMFAKNLWKNREKQGEMSCTIL